LRGCGASVMTLAEALRRLHQQRLPLTVLDDLKEAEDDGDQACDGEGCDLCDEC
jgi:hypothetical protein